jgi:thiol-disulfide isomerase/thioredoxin
VFPVINKTGCLAVLLLSVALSYGAELNTPAPTFALTNSHRQKRALSDYKGKVVFINFWASWCGPCQEELPLLNRLAGDYPGKKVRVLAINVDADRQAAVTALKRLGLSHASLEILWDLKSKVVSAYNIETMPSSFVLDQHGVIRFVHIGFRSQDPEKWRQEINLLIEKKG